MSDYNLITIPVVDERRTMIGLITVDDVLEVTLPEDWRRREAAEPPDAHRGGALVTEAPEPAPRAGRDLPGPAPDDPRGPVPGDRPGAASRLAPPLALPIPP